MKSKSIYLAIFSLIIALLTACSPRTVDIAPQYHANISENVSLTTNSVDDSTSVGTLDELISYCSAVALVEITDITAYNSHELEHNCRVITDYFGNLNYSGMDNGYITLQTTGEESWYQVGDLAILFLTAQASESFPYVLYFDADNFCRVKLLDDGTLEIFATDAQLTYGVSSDTDLNEYITAYAKTHTKPAIEAIAAYSSYENAVLNSAVAINVTVNTRSEYTKYLDKIDVTVGTVLFGETDYLPNNTYTIRVPKNAVTVPGEDYVILLNENGRVIISDYTIMTAEQYAQLTSN